MEESIKSIESLLEKTTEYGKTSFEIVKLKLIDKVSDGISSFIPISFVLFFFFCFFLFINLGIALWIGDLLANIYYGFFAVGAINLLISLIFYFFLGKWIKRIYYDKIVRIISKEIK
ncbi:MAG: hypothetical protein H6Q16_192 [Bacteroidetes bacterium]|nr:hypothetical protein [Bacteroidota bacterium]